MRTFSPFRLLALVLVVGLGIVLAGCGITKSKSEADATLTRRFQTIATNGFSAAMSDYDSDFFQNTSKETWSKALKKLVSKVGTYQSHTIVDWNSFSNFGGANSGTRVILKCEVVYSKRTVRESFTLFKPATSSDYKIVGHTIDAAALLED